MNLFTQTFGNSRYWTTGCLMYFCCVLNTFAQEIKSMQINKYNQNKQGTINSFPVKNENINWMNFPVLPGDSINNLSGSKLNNRFSDKDSLNTDPALFLLVMRQKMDKLPYIPNYAYGDYYDFKYKLLHMKVEDPLAFLKQQISKEKKRLPKNPLPGTKVDQFSPVAFGVSLGISPITAIYNIFSKDFHSRKMLAEVTNREPLIRLANAKFNRDLVSRVTRLNGNQLDEFIIKYRPSDDYLIAANEYDIIDRIFKDVEVFRLQLAKEKNDSISKARRDSINFNNIEDSINKVPVLPGIE